MGGKRLNWLPLHFSSESALLVRIPYAVFIVLFVHKYTFQNGYSKRLLAHNQIVLAHGPMSAPTKDFYP